MTEAEWLPCTDPLKMLDYLRCRLGKEDRKLRLFACALLRAYLWEFLTDKRSRRAVAVSERYGDGIATEKELAAARRNAKAAHRSLAKPDQAVTAPLTKMLAAGCAAAVAVKRGADAAQIWYGARLLVPGKGPDNPADLGRCGYISEIMGRRSNPRGCELLREIIGNPFRPVVVDPSWLTWQDATVKKLAQGIYHERTFDRLPILADALEEAGCTDADILSHCRGPGPHVRGCFVVDLCLGLS